MDGLKAFSYICDNVPEWKESLKALAYTVNERHNEFTRISRIALGVSSLRRQRTGSTESLRPDDEVPTPDALPDPIELSPQSARVEVDPDAKRLFQDYRLRAKRKRISGSAASNMSGRPRSRMSLIVYYDSAIQDSFETIVRSIAAARNTLRKGKTAASMRSRMAGMAMEESPFGASRTSLNMHDNKIARLARPSQAGDAYAAEPFERIDRELESAQTLCEIGAHQFLRDGTCQDELAGAQERIDSILPIAQEQRALYEAEAKEAAAKNVYQDLPTQNQQTTSYELSAVDGMPAMDSNMLGSIAIDNTWAGGVSHTTGANPAVGGNITVFPDVAVDSASVPLSQIAIDPGFSPSPAVQNSSVIALDPAFAIDPAFTANASMAIAQTNMVDSAISMGTKATPSAAPNGIAIDPAHTNSVAVDSAHADGITMDPAHANGIAVDPAHTNGISVDPVHAEKFGGDIMIDPAAINVAVDPAMTGSGPLAIEVDTADSNPYMIDIAMFRRTQRRYM